MKQLNSGQIRQMFLDFFHEKGHEIVPSASLIPKDDPTLLWINSGVATMKKYFDGSVAPANPRMTSSQKSIRTNDIENVGRTARHQTLFEMLGNFSVGDYFKKEVIPWAFELLTSEKWFGWDKDRLYVTYYPEDKETKELWEKVGIAPDHLVPAEDNFWDIGQGPSGPDSEIFYDRGAKYDDLAPDDPENYPGGENERYLEVWNIVFSQFNHTAEGTYEPLPRKNIDTGMGLERVVSVFQDAPTNFETDLFLPLIKKTETFSDNRHYGNNAEDDISFKVIADHIRAITFAIGDGALPSNEGRGYVIRRLLRRATVNGHQLGINGAFLYKLVPVVGEIMQSHYPHVLEQKDYIQKIVKSEEDRFNATLNDGIKLLDDLIAKTKEAGQKEIAGKDAFQLYDTYGFPLELTEEYANDRGIQVDETGFDQEMEQQRARARAARGSKGSMKVQRDLLLEIKTPSEYVGYDQLTVPAAQLQDLIVDEQLVDQATTGTAEVIFDQTPFYAEMGGQVADTGKIYDEANQEVATVTDVQHAPNGQNLHTVQVTGKLQKGSHYRLEVNRQSHAGVERNHTATHLLDQSLRNVLGGHTEQAGSLVKPDYLTFDFNHFGSVTKEDLAKVERMVNDHIFAALPVETVVTDQKTGKEMGAIALFDDKYGDQVRVVKAGDFSVEFCGGDHVNNTSQIGLFKILSESGVGAGIRRIKAVTGKYAFDYLNDEEKMLTEIAQTIKVPTNEQAPGRVKELQAQIKELESTQESLEAKLANQEAQDLFNHPETINGVTLITGQLENANMNQLRELADTWRNEARSNVLVLGTANDGKANLLVAVDEEHVKAGIKAGDLIKAIAKHIQGGGGGRPNLAQAGGKNPAGLPAALQAASEWLATK
ncbi:alanine--tRNA ligase [Fructilactobacillus hinvesii]|uniref:Alanine--tRNA ligase n=1 Tax=Fructilactobacillus hinvesii TaxID=2940300 RepID=A0ABY5BRC8_9LACO|nr:alanine--tRNA ligase [Fructilactobacillus hinvesii]USS87667.1 alanine--tRNA ligase [Fructilactobacillus hinvesii]